MGALDATTHQVMASKFGIKGFPTIKYFAPGSSADDAVDYDGGRTSSDIVQWALNKVFHESLNFFQLVCTRLFLLLSWHFIFFSVFCYIFILERS